MKIVNEQQLRDGFAKMRAALEPIAAQNDTDGCSARCHLAAGEPLNRFIVAEVERQTPSMQVAEALSAVMSSGQALYTDILYLLDDANLGDAKFSADVAEGGRA